MDVLSFEDCGVLAIFFVGLCWRKQATAGRPYELCGFTLIPDR